MNWLRTPTLPPSDRLAEVSGKDAAEVTGAAVMTGAAAAEEGVETEEGGAEALVHHVELRRRMSWLRPRRSWTRRWTRT